MSKLAKSIVALLLGMACGESVSERSDGGLDDDAQVSSFVDTMSSINDAVIDERTPEDTLASINDAAVDVGTPSGNTYYVSTTGDDSHAGDDPSIPWRHCPGMLGWSGKATLSPGDLVVFKSDDVWQLNGHFGKGRFLRLAPGVTYDGSSWGSGKRATFRVMTPFSTSRAVVIFFDEDHPVFETRFRGFEVDGNGKTITGIGVNWPNNPRSLEGAFKVVEDCEVHDLKPGDSKAYGIKIGASQGHTIANVKILDSKVHGIPWTAVIVYLAVDSLQNKARNVTIRGCEVFNSENGIAFKNHCIDCVAEYNYVHDNDKHGLKINSTEPYSYANMAGFHGPERAVFRYNIAARNGSGGMAVITTGDKSIDIYGNLSFRNNHGIKFAGNLADTLEARVYNNTFYANEDNGILVEQNSAKIVTFEVKNNIFFSSPNARCINDATPKTITAHSHNLYHRPSGGDCVRIGSQSYSALAVGNWESTALSGDPGLKNVGNLPDGFVGVYGTDIRPNTDGLSLVSASLAKDKGASLGPPYDSGIDGVQRPNGAWDIGAYEYAPVK